MKSFYELLGASADDDAEALKKAFRKSVKAHHPDLHPNDPDAPSRFRQIVAANALLRNAKQRANYDRVLQLESQKFRLEVECQQLRSKLERQRLRLKRIRATAAVAAIAAILGGYRLFAPMPTAAIVEMKKDEHAATTAAWVKNDRRTATVAEILEKDNNPSTANAAHQTQNTSKAAAGTDSIGGEMDNGSQPGHTAGFQQMEHAKPENRDEPIHEIVVAGIPAGVIKFNPTPAAINRGDNQVIANRQLALGPSNDANFYRERGIASYRRGDFSGAIANFDEVIRLDPNDAQAYNIRGNAWDELGVFDRALADYEEAIRIDPNNPDVFHDRAILWQRRGALDKALIDLDRAIRFSFTDANIYCDRGLVWHEKGRHDRAIADFNQAAKLNPSFAAACINRGVISHRNPSIFDAILRTNSPR